MRFDGRLLAALAFSLLLHMLVVSSPGWRLPFTEEAGTSVTLEAHLALKPSAIAVPQPAPRPSPRPAARQPRPALPAVEAPAPPEAAVPEARQPAAVQPEPALDPPAVASSPAAAPVELPWPRQGRIRFAVTRGEGEQTTLVGQSTHTWQHDDANYILQTLTETVGLAAVFRPAKVVQTSEGTLGTEGIAPREFRVERMGRAAERARFDRGAMRVTLYSGEQVRRELPLAAGSQDVLSQIYQIGLTRTARIELMIATGKSYGRHVFETVGEEGLATRFGELRTWHLRASSLRDEQAMELWLATEYRNLPVRIRYIDRKGEVFEQNAVELVVDGAKLAERAQ